MLSETIHTWAPEIWSFIDNTNDEDSDTTVDANSFLNTAEIATLQFQDLFGQDVFDFDASDSPYYDEFTFVPNQTQDLLNTIEPSDMINSTSSETSKRRRSSTSSLSSYLSSFSSSEVEDDEHSFSSLPSRSISSESFTSTHRRALEEIILDKITNQLDPENLPGILTIISSTVEDDVEEVEIDLARLDMDQLTRILTYIDACLYTPTPKKVTHNDQRRRPSIIEQGHVVSGKLHASVGPMSSVMESDSDSSTAKRKKRTKKRNKQKNNNHKKEKSISKKPKKKTALHKRRLLEEMTHPANNETDDDEGEVTEGGDGILIFSDEQMDFAVTQNETIVHQQRRQSIIIQSKPTPPVKKEEVEEDDELIDIML